MTTFDSAPSRAVRHAATAACALAAASLLAGCASTRLDAQWADADLASHRLGGQKVLVACEAYEPVVKQLCLERMSAELAARGATPIVSGAGPSSGSMPPSTPGRPVTDEDHLAAARRAGASAVMVTSMAIASASSSGSGLSFGLGGFGGHVGGGVGVSVPVGGARTQDGYAANGKLLDAASGRLLWTAKASTPPSTDVARQVDELARTMVAAGGDRSLF